MRKRNSLVFRMVEAEEEYCEQIEVLIACFLRPFKMAASSKKPPCTHEDLNSIFLNSETILFLHQIFLKGLTSRLENWPTLVLGDLFSILLPMLSIYQEYVRNHHYSLQVLTECKQLTSFTALLVRLENKSACKGRTLETFLTYPMYQIPRYIITLHELLAHTPHEHVERVSLENAKQNLEDLSRQIHDKVSETENLRKNLAIERMIVEGCDILLDVDQVFVRQGALIHISTEKTKPSRGKLNFKTEKQILRQCFLFSKHLIIATRTSNGKLHLAPDIGKIALIDTTLIEETQENFEDEDSSICSVSSQSSVTKKFTATSQASDSRDFKLMVEMKIAPRIGQVCVHLVAASSQEKAAWISDIGQCLDNVHFNDMIRPTRDDSFIDLPQSINHDLELFKDETDIRFSKTLTSCNIPQIRYATPERLLEQLTDLRFLSTDFLNTFLLTYRIFTDGVIVLETLIKVFYSTDSESLDSVKSLETFSRRDAAHLPDFFLNRRSSNISPRRISGASFVSGHGSEISGGRNRSYSYDSQGYRHWKSTLEKYDEENLDASVQEQLSGGENISAVCEPKSLIIQTRNKKISINVENTQNSGEEQSNLAVAKVTASDSTETLTDANVLCTTLSSSGNLSSVTLMTDTLSNNTSRVIQTTTIKSSITDLKREHQHPFTTATPESNKKVEKGTTANIDQLDDTNIQYHATPRSSYSSSRSTSIYMTNTSTVLQNCYGPRKSIQNSESIMRSSFQHVPRKHSKAGVVVTSSRKSKRRISISRAAAAFAIATSGSSNPRDHSPSSHANKKGHAENQDEVLSDKSKCKENIITTACTMRVLNVLRHWISKYSQDFENDGVLKFLATNFLDDIIYSPNILTIEHKVAGQILRIIHGLPEKTKVDLVTLLTIPSIPTIDNIDTISALEIAEQLTYLDHHIFVSIKSEEFLGQAWMKIDKSVKAPSITLMTKHFNEVSNLVASEIIRRSTITSRVAAIEKWAAVADICRCLHNFNGVLQICAAFTNCSVYRLKKTWEKVSKTTKQTIEKLQNIVSSDARFRALRDALHRCDPPCIPYVGLYLSDLSFIEEGSPNFIENNLVNFSKMRMIANVIREIRNFQQASYKIVLNRKVADYLLDSSLLVNEDDLYKRSLEIESRTSRLSNAALTSLSLSGSTKL